MAEPGRRSNRPRAYSPVWIVITVIATIAVMVLGVAAGRWQYDRYEVRAEAVRAFDAAQGSPAAPLSTLIAPGADDVGAGQWRLATASGHFDQESLTALRGRSVQGVAVLHYLAWFVTEDGALLVDVGWSERDAGTTVSLPAGTMTIAGLLREQEADDGRRGDGATRIVTAQMPAPTEPVNLLPGWLMLREPCAASGCVDTTLQPAPVPQLSLGPHLSYAFQWWLLALLAPFAAVFLVRRDARLERDAELSSAALEIAPVTPRKARGRGGPSDEEIEDALE